MCLQAAPGTLDDDETVIVLTGAVVDERVGLCIVTDGRLLFLDEDQGGRVAGSQTLREVSGSAELHITGAPDPRASPLGPPTSAGSRPAALVSEAHPNGGLAEGSE